MIESGEFEKDLTKIYKKDWVKDEGWKEILNQLQVQAYMKVKQASSPSDFTSKRFQRSCPHISVTLSFFEECI